MASFRDTDSLLFARVLHAERQCKAKPQNAEKMPRSLMQIVSLLANGNGDRKKSIFRCKRKEAVERENQGAICLSAPR